MSHHEVSRPRRSGREGPLRTIAISDQWEGRQLHVFLLLRLPASPLAAAAARHALVGLAPFLDREVVENAELLVSELVTNSVRHAGLPPEASIELCVRASSEVVMVEVADSGRGFTHGSQSREQPVPGAERMSGWGLFLVETIADRWGAVEVEGETRVWFELRPGAHANGTASGTATSGSKATGRNPRRGRSTDRGAGVRPP